MYDFIASSPSREPDPGPTISTASELSQVWVSADPTHFDLKRMRDEAAMELVWLEQAITSRKQVGVRRKMFVAVYAVALIINSINH